MEVKNLFLGRCHFCNQEIYGNIDIGYETYVELTPEGKTFMYHVNCYKEKSNVPQTVYHRVRLKEE